MTKKVSISEDYTKNLQKYKLVFLGEQSVGKTSLITKFMYDSFEQSYQATIGIDFLSKTIYLAERNVRLQLWDTAGQERFHSLIPAYIRDSSVAIIVYDTTNVESFLQVDKWLRQVRQERGLAVIIVLVGNKIDLKDTRQVSTDTGEEKAKQNGILFVETSAKNGFNVKFLFRTIAESLIKKEEFNTKKFKDFHHVILENNIANKPNVSYCNC